MKWSLVLSLLMIGNSAFAAIGYELTMEISRNGKKISSVGLLVAEGQAGSIAEESSTTKTSIEVVAKEEQMQNHKGILLNFVLNHQSLDGKDAFVAKPRILVKENETAHVSIGDKNDALTFKVIAKRKAL